MLSAAAGLSPASWQSAIEGSSYTVAKSLREAEESEKAACNGKRGLSKVLLPSRASALHSALWDSLKATRDLGFLMSWQEKLICMVYVVIGI